MKNYDELATVIEQYLDAVITISELMIWAEAHGFTRLEVKREISNFLQGIEITK